MAGRVRPRRGAPERWRLSSACIGPLVAHRRDRRNHHLAVRFRRSRVARFDRVAAPRADAIRSGSAHYRLQCIISCAPWHRAVFAPYVLCAVPRARFGDARAVRGITLHLHSVRSDDRGQQGCRTAPRMRAALTIEACGRAPPAASRGDRGMGAASVRDRLALVLAVCRTIASIPRRRVVHAGSLRGASGCAGSRPATARCSRPRAGQPALHRTGRQPRARVPQGQREPEVRRGKNSARSVGGRTCQVPQNAP